jgi:Domain of unknown function (DUF4157)
MHEDDGSAANGRPDTTIAVAERWRPPALDIARRWLPGRRWLAFAAAVEEGPLTTFLRASPKRRDRGQGAGWPDAWDGPARLASGDLALIGGARRAAEIDRRPGDAAAGRDPRDRQAGRAGSWPDDEATAPAPRREVRAAADPNSASIEQHVVRADARFDDRLSAGALHGGARPLDPYVQGWLSRLLDLRIPAVRIHTGQAADATARRFNADAVSFGPDIMFRAGRFAPDSATGLGLLGHELTHIARAHSDRFAAPPDRTALDREEAVAIENEKRVLQHATGKRVMTANIAVAPREHRSTAARRAPTPRAASVDRGVAPPTGDSDALSPAPELTAQQLGALKEAIYRDLMDRIRTDFERGA